MTDGSLARRYAKALLELGQEAAKADIFGAQLDAFVRLALSNGGQLHGVMSNPSFTPSERRAVLDAVIARVELEPMVVNFLKLVLEKDRFAALPDIAREYGALADALANRSAQRSPRQPRPLPRSSAKSPAPSPRPPAKRWLWKPVPTPRSSAASWPVWAGRSSMLHSALAWSLSR